MSLSVTTLVALSVCVLWILRLYVYEKYCTYFLSPRLGFFPSFWSFRWALWKTQALLRSFCRFMFNSPPFNILCNNQIRSGGCVRGFRAGRSFPVNLVQSEDVFLLAMCVYHL